MYLAKNVGRWTTTIIGRFYNGRDHSTVCHGIQRIEALRESDPDVDTLVTDLKRQLAGDGHAEGADVATNQRRPVPCLSLADLDYLAELIAARVCARIERQTRPAHQNSKTD